MDVNEKVALVTGGLSGIGLGTIRELLRNGIKNVTIVDINTNIANNVLQKLREEFGNKIIFLKANVAETKQLEEAFIKTITAFNVIDIVFNNAGIINEIEWEETLNVNLKATIMGTNLAYKYMGKHNGGNGGTVINSSSVVFMGTSSAMPVYTATKFGVLGLGLSFGHSYHYDKTGIKFLTICPGATDTSLMTNGKLFDDAVTKQFENLAGELYFQSIDTVGRHIVSIIRKGDHGDIWMIEDNKALKVKYPLRDQFEKIELPL